MNKTHIAGGMPLAAGSDQCESDHDPQPPPPTDPPHPDDLLRLIQSTWARLAPAILKNPDDLAQRLARRRNGMMNRPPRAWCLAIRAADSRINSGTAIIVPEEAAYPRSLVRGENHVYRRHHVTLDARLMHRLCRVLAPGRGKFTEQDLMAELGAAKHNLKFMVKAGMVRKDWISGLGGKWGWPIPVYEVHKPLDPGARLRENADGVWGTLCRRAVDYVPKDLSQQVERVPCFSPRFHARRYAAHEVFIGWKWVCPSCRRPCRTIFYPLPPLSWVQLLDKEFHDSDPNHPDALPKGNQSFACMLCHSVMYHSRLDCETWNRLVSHLSAGLLWGHEVPRPSWYGQQRKRPFVPKLRREPSKRREQVRRMLLEGLGATKIALELGLTKSTVGTYASQIYRQEGVKGVEALRAKMGSSHIAPRMRGVL